MNLYVPFRRTGEMHGTTIGSKDGDTRNYGLTRTLT